MSDFDIRMPSGTDDPLSDAEIQQYRKEIDRLDRVILDAVKRRSEVSRAIGTMVDEWRLNWVWMPPWGPERITEDGRDQMRALGFNI